MHAFSTAFVFLIAVLPLVLSTPIPVWSSTVVNKPAVDDEASRARATTYHDADARAQEMVSKMVAVANSDKPEHQQIVNDAFGPNADREKIKAIIHRLDTQEVQTESTDVAIFRSRNPQKANALVAKAYVHRPDPTTGIGVSTGPIRLGALFFESKTNEDLKDFRAGALIHEATHQQSNTGDIINKQNKIIGGLENQHENVDEKTQHVGYHVPEGPDRKKVPTSAADLSAVYKNNRDNRVENMEENADSYRVFAHLCSQPGIARRDIELFSRALLEADADDHFYLAKRNSCALPQDYFKKKAAAKAAAAGRETESIKPTSHLAKGAATEGAHEHAVSKAGRKPITGKSLTASKGTKSIKPTSHPAKHLTNGAATKGAHAQAVSKAGRKSSARKALTTSKETKSIKLTSHLTKGAATKGAHVQAVSKAGRKSSGGKALTAGKGSKSIKQTSHLTRGAATKGTHSHTVAKAWRKAGKALAISKGTKFVKPTSPLTKGATTKGAHAHSVSKAGRKSSAGKALTSSKETKIKLTSHLTKGAATKGAHVHAKAGRKPSGKALNGAAKRVSRVASPRRALPKGASGVKSHGSTKFTNPIPRVAKEASKRTSHSSPKAARKSIVSPSSGTAKRVTSPQRAQAKVNHVAQKNVAASLPKKSTPRAAPRKKAGKSRLYM